jgi:uncharacterized LabA/DUF88 family protein
MATTPTESIALLIDADNAPAAKIDFIISELASHGVVNIRRAYGNWTKPSLSGWTKTLHEHAIQPVQLFDMVKGKNGTDMALVIDAMNMLYSRNVDTFCLVSSDCDFTPLCIRLRADGKQVIGFGGKNTPDPFINSCTKFLFLEEQPKSKQASKKVKIPGENLKGNSKLLMALRNAVEAAEDEEGWAPLGPVGSHLNNQSPFDHRTYGYKKLSDLFENIDLFEVKKNINANGTFLSVRLKKGSKKKTVIKKAAKKSSAH